MHQWASEFIQAHRRGTYFVRAFQNTVLAEAYSTEVEVPPDPGSILARREPYSEFDGEIVLPQATGLLTCGVDPQMDRIEYAITAWEEHDEQWNVQYGVLPGNPELQHVWTQLFGVITKSWRHASGHVLTPAVVCIDAGFLDSRVAQFCRNTSRRGMTVCSTIGKRGFDRQWLKKSRTSSIDADRYRLSESGSL
jgi:phage terminase large subunit GpA-like protein